MKNTKINYEVSMNGSEAETLSVVTENGWELEDVLQNAAIAYEREGDTYYLLDDEGERNGQSYRELGSEDTDEAISEDF